MLHEVERAPRRILEQAMRIGMRQACVALEVWLERLVLLHHLDQLGLDVCRRRLERAEPRQCCAWIELDLRQAGKEIVARLLEVDLLFPRQDLERLAEA